MPLLVHCDELQAGMRLAEAFLFRGRMMLPGGKLLNREDVEILKRKYADATLMIGDPLLDSVAQFEDDSKEREVAKTAQGMVTQSLVKVQERFASRTAIGSVNVNAMRSAASGVVEYLKNHPVSAVLLTRSNDPANYLAEHTGNVFYLSLVLGSAVRDYVVRERMRQTAVANLSSTISMDLLPLGLGAMFMDVGMYPLERIYQAGYELTEADKAEIRQHPVAGCDLLPENLPPGVKMVVRTHHENYDGTGYPNSVPGSDQHIFTRIVRICDAFEAATAQRVYASARSPVRVLWEMCAGPMRRCYDPVLAKVFRMLIQPFPIGAKLKMADGRWGVVVRYNRKEPFCPLVIVAFDQRGERIPGDFLEKPFHAGEGTHSRIAGFNGEDLSFLYSTPMEPAEVAENVAAKAFATVLDVGYP